MLAEEDKRMNAPSQTISHDQATYVIQGFFEGTRPQKDSALEVALAMKGLTLDTIELLKAAARKVTRGKAPFCVLTPTGGKNRLKPILDIPSLAKRLKQDQAS